MKYLGFFRNLSITKQVMILFSITLAIFYYTNIQVRQNFLKLREESFTKERILQGVSNSILNLQIEQKDFIIKNQSSTSLYQTHESVYKEGFYKEMKLIVYKIMALESMEKDALRNRKMIEIEHRMLKYSNEFSTFTTLFKELGYNHVGIAGELEKGLIDFKVSQYNTQDSKARLLIDLLEEQNFKARFQDFQTEDQLLKFNEITFEAGNYFKHSVSFKNYAKICNKFVSVYRKVGLAENNSAPKAMSEVLINAQSDVLDLMSYYQNEQLTFASKLNNIKIFEFVLLFVFLSLVLIIAHKVSKDVKIFIETVKNVKKHDWGKKIETYSSLEAKKLAFEINGMIDSLKDTTIDLAEKNRLYSTEKSLNELVKKTDSAIWTLDLKTKSFTSIDGEKIYGYSNEEISADNTILTKNIFEEDMPKVEVVAKNMYETGMLDMDHRIVKKDKTVIWINVKIKVGYDVNKSPTHLFGITTDVTVSKKNEATIKDQEQILVQLSKMSTIGEISSSIIHEIKNPIAIISASSQYLAILSEDSESVSKKDINGILEKIERGVTRVERIIESLSIASRSVRDEFQDLTVSSVVSDSIEIVGGKARSARVILNNSSDPEIMVRGRASDLSQVLINLISNSVDAVSQSEDRWIRIETQETDSLVRICVVDSGFGIPPEVADKMFNAFYTTKEVGKGTGLGLSISKKAIQEHGGRMYFDQNSINTRIVIELPNPKKVIALAA